MACSKAANTLTAYESSWRFFREWCDEAGRSFLPASPGTVCDFIAWSLEQSRNYSNPSRRSADGDEKLRLNTVRLRMKAIAHYHRQVNLPPPTQDSQVRSFLNNAARERQERPGGKAPVTPDQLRKIALFECERPSQVRNRAMLLLAFASGWRRSEVVALDRADVEFLPGRGMGLTQWKSKTDQKGVGRYVGIHFGDNPGTCPVRAVRAWLEIRGEWQGPLFTRLSPRGTVVTHERLESRGDVLYHAVKKYMERIGEDPALYGAHSTRSGHVTAASEAGATIASIKLRTGHKDTKTMEKYIRIPTAFGTNPMAGVL